MIVFDDVMSYGVATNFLLFLSFHIKLVEARPNSFCSVSYLRLVRLLHRAANRIQKKVIADSARRKTLVCLSVT